MRTAEEVLAKPCADLPEDGILQAVIVIYQWYRPGGDDPDDRGPFLAFNRDTEWGVWNQLGMLQTVADDLRGMLKMEAQSD